MSSIQLSRWNCSVNSISAKFIQTVVLVGMQESIPTFHEELSVKGMCDSLKVLSPYRKFSTWLSRHLAKEKVWYDWWVKTQNIYVFLWCCCNNLQLFNTRYLRFPSISSTFYFSFLSYKAVYFRLRGRRKNVHCIHDDCSVLWHSYSVTRLEEIVPHVHYTLLLT